MAFCSFLMTPKLFQKVVNGSGLAIKAVQRLEWSIVLQSSQVEQRSTQITTAQGS